MAAGQRLRQGGNMVTKGLCATCQNDGNCIFQSAFPVWQCEEFVNANHKPVKAKYPAPAKEERFAQVILED